MSIESMRNLTGMKLVRPAKPDRVRARIALVENGERLCSLAQPQRDASSAVVSESITAPKIIGHEHVWVDLFFVDDPQAIPLGTLEGRKEVVLAMKRMKNWNSVYTLNPVLPAAFLRALAGQAGIHIYSNRDDTLYASRSYLTLAADKAGRRTVMLPHRCDVFEPFSGEALWRGITQFESIFRAKEVVIWRLELA